MKIGIVDLDTSHPQNWIPILREMGHEIVGVWDGGAVHPKEYVQTFARERDIPRVYDSLDSLAADADCAIIHGCDWDTHVAKAEPFVAAGRSVLLDKPVAGNVADLARIRGWIADGARIAGGSSLRFCNEAQEYLARPESERGTPHTVLCGCGVDEFNYGIHAYSFLAALVGTGAERVRHRGERGQRRIEVLWPDGRIGLLSVGTAAAYLPFYATVVADRTVTHLQVDSSGLYHALLNAVLPYLAGEADAPLDPNALLEPERWAIAARRSWESGDAEVRLDEIPPDDPGYDGAAFAVGYQKMRYPDAKG